MSRAHRTVIQLWRKMLSRRSTWLGPRGDSSAREPLVAGRDSSICDQSAEDRLAGGGIAVVEQSFWNTRACRGGRRGWGRLWGPHEGKNEGRPRAHVVLQE